MSDNPSGMKCDACRAAGYWHCSDPVNCGGMKPMTPANDKKGEDKV